jgi:hypothetical protein
MNDDDFESYPGFKQANLGKFLDLPNDDDVDRLDCTIDPTANLYGAKK